MKKNVTVSLNSVPKAHREERICYAVDPIVVYAEPETSINHAHDAGVPALQRLFALVETRNSGQIFKIAKFLAGLYNGYAYPFDLTELRGLDKSILEDCLLVLRMDAKPEKEVHEYFENGQARWQRMIVAFGVKARDPREIEII